MFYLLFGVDVQCLHLAIPGILNGQGRGDHKVDCVDFLLLYLISLDPKIDETYISQLDL